MLCQCLGEVVPEQEFSVRTLGRALDRRGFTFGKGVRSQRFKEKDHVVAARQRHLRRKISNRKGQETIRSEVYSDESYVNKNHSNDFVWHCDDDGPWIQKPAGKGERLTIMNAITEDGWVPGSEVTFNAPGSHKKTITAIRILIRVFLLLSLRNDSDRRGRPLCLPCFGCEMSGQRICFRPDRATTGGLPLRISTCHDH